MPPKKSKVEEKDAVEGPSPKVAKTMVAASASELIPKPDVGEKGKFDMVKYMKSVIKYVHAAAPAMLSNLADPRFEVFKGIQNLSAVKPLEIGRDGQMLGYKQTWDKLKAKISLETTDRHETGISLFWLLLFSGDEEHATIAGDTNTLEDLNTAVDIYFTPSGNCKSLKKGRLVFPVTVPIHAELQESLDKDSFDQEMMVVTGQLYCFALYEAIFRAMEKGDEDSLSLLLQCALTLTGHVYTGLSKAELAANSCKHSEYRKADADLVTDSFVAFSRKVEIILKEVPAGINYAGHEKFLAEAGIRFNKAAIGKQILSATRLVNSLTKEQLDILGQIGRRHGKNVLTGGYFKLMRILQICSKDAISHEPLTEELLTTFVLQDAKFILDHGLIDPKDFGSEFLSPKKADEAGWILASTSKRIALNIILNVVPSDDQAPGMKELSEEVHRIAAWFQDYYAFEENFPNDDPSADTQVSDAGNENGSVVQSKLTEKLNGLSKAGAMALNILFDIYSDVYAATFKNLRSGKPKDNALNQAKILADDGGLGKAFKDLVETVNFQRQSIVSLNPSTPLVRQKGASGVDDDDAASEQAAKQEEMKKVLATCQNERKKFATLFVPRAWSEAELSRLLGGWDKHQKFEGKPGESHFGLAFSAELVCREEGSTPWQTPVDWTPQHDVILDALASHKSKNLAHLAFDGRSRKSRNKIEEKMETLPYAQELFVTYKATTWYGKKPPFASQNTEVFHLSLPVSPYRWKVEDRSTGDGNAAGEESKFNSTYTGVQALQVAAMAKLGAADKQKILGGPMPQLPHPKFWDASQGHPLFWRERKSAKFLKLLIKHAKVKAIFDFTPGSGQLALACFEAGIPYAGVCQNQDHLSWLGQVLDRHIMRLTLCPGTPMFSQTTASVIKEYYKDVTDALEKAEAALDPSIEETED